MGPLLNHLETLVTKVGSSYLGSDWRLGAASRREQIEPERFVIGKVSKDEASGIDVQEVPVVLSFVDVEVTLVSAAIEDDRLLSNV